MSDIETAGQEPAPSDVPASPAEAPPLEQSASDTNTPAEEPGEGEEQQPQDEQPKPRQKASERISQIYGRMKAAERERDQFRAELERYRQPMVSQEEWDQMSWEDQQALQIRHAVRTERAEELAQEAQRREVDAFSRRADLFNERVAAASEAIPGIEAAISDPTLPISQVGAQFVAEAENGPQVAYWLSQNRADAARIARLDPLSQAFELGQISQRITAAPKARKVSNAPAPVPRVGGAGAAGGKDPASMSMDEYAQWFASRSGS